MTDFETLKRLFVGPILIGTIFAGCAVCLCQQANLPVSVAPIWTAQIVEDLSNTQTRSSKLWPRALIKPSVAGLVFLDNSHLMVHEVGPTGELSSRTVSSDLSSYRLHSTVIETESGKILFSRDWRTHPRESSIHVTNGGVLLRTGGKLRFYTYDFATAKDVVIHDITPGNGVITKISTSANRKTIMINKINQKERSSSFTVLDGNTLNVLYAWTESPAVYSDYSIFETKFARLDNHAISTSQFGTGKWEILYREKGTCVNSLLMISDDELVNTCEQISLIAANGREVPLESLGDRLSVDKVEVSQDCRFAAFSVSDAETIKHLFSEPGQRLMATRIEVFNLSSMKRVFTVAITPLPKSDYDFALSPGGSRLAVLNDRAVSAYLVPLT